MRKLVTNLTRTTNMIAHNVNYTVASHILASVLTDPF